MKKILQYALFLLIAAFTLTGCSNHKTENLETAKVTGLEKITVKTTGNDIVIEETDGDEITASIVGFSGDLITKEGDILVIDIPTPDGIIHLSAPETLYIGIPSMGIASLSAVSDTGNIQIGAVNIHEVSISTQVGNITANGFSGVADLKTELGKIETN